MKPTLFLLLLALISCGETTSTKYPPVKERTTTITSQETITTISKDQTSDDGIRYVNTTSNLNYRDRPEGEKLGSFKPNDKVTIVDHSNVFTEITDEGKQIKGEWVGVLKDGDVVYVFDAFLSKTSATTDVWSKFPVRKTPFIDSIGFDNVHKTNRLTKKDITELQLEELYPDILKKDRKVYPSYQLDYGDYKSIVVNVFKNEHELESVLIIYDTDNTLHKLYQGEGEEPSINSLIVSYDEIAEGWSSITAQFNRDCITIVDALYTDTPVIDTTLYHINNQGLINKVNTDFVNDIRPNKKLKLHTVYTDTIEFINYNDEGDYFFMEAVKDHKDIYLYYNWDGEDKYDFKKNDLIEVQWKIDSAWVAEDITLIVNL